MQQDEDVLALMLQILGPSRSASQIEVLPSFTHWMERAGSENALLVQEFVNSLDVNQDGRISTPELRLTVSPSPGRSLWLMQAGAAGERKGADGCEAARQTGEGEACATDERLVADA